MLTMIIGVVINILLLFISSTSLAPAAKMAGTEDPASPGLGINVQDYNASGSNVTTVSVRPVDLGASSVTVGNVSTFSVNQGLAIVGAGAGGGIHVGKITGISGNIVTFSPATATTVRAGAVVQHDDTFAIRQAVAAAHVLKTTVIRLPRGLYRVNAPKDGSYVIKLTGVAADAEYESITLEGEGQPVLMSGTVPNTASPYPTSGTIIQSDSQGGAILGTDSNGSFAGLHVTLRNLTVRSYDNPNITAADFSYAAWLSVYNCVFDTGRYTLNETEPTHANAKGLVAPTTNNGAFTVVRDSLFQGYYVGFRAYEHTVGDSIVVAGNKVGLSVGGGFSHALHFGRVLAQNNQINVQSLSGDGAFFEIEQLDIEHPNHEGRNRNPSWQNPVWDLDDPGNSSVGRINVLFTEGYQGILEGSQFLRNGGRKIAVSFINSTVKSPAIALRKNSDLTLTDDTFTPVPFDIENQEVGDLYNMHSLTTNPSRVSIVETGLYSMVGTLSFAPNPSGARLCRITVNGGPAVGFAQVGASPAGNTRLQCTAITVLHGGDFVQLEAYFYTGKGDTLALKSEPDFSPTFSLTRIK